MTASHDRMHLLAELSVVSERFKNAWRMDLVGMLLSRETYKQVAPALGEYRISLLINHWYRDHLVMGCRRLVDAEDDTVSIRNALYRLRRIADELSPELLVEHRASQVARTADERREDVAVVRRELADFRPSSGPDTPLTARAVQGDLDRMRDVSDRVHRLATVTVAHRLDPQKAPLESITFGEIYGLLDDLADVHVRWSGLLRCAHVVTEVDHLGVARPFLRALELFDWESYVRVLERPEARERGLHSLDDLDQHARVRFELPDTHD